MYNKFLKIFSFLFLLLFISISSSNAQVKEDKEENSLNKQGSSYPPRLFGADFYSQAGLSFGYDSNVNLSPDRKGDLFEEALYSLQMEKPLFESQTFILNYDLDALTYNEITDASSILNHFRFTLDTKSPVCSFGFGYDLGILYYPYGRNGNFLFHRGFLYLRKEISPNTYHMLTAEYGIKEYTYRKALSDSISTFQNKERLDRRESLSYGINSSLTDRLFAQAGVKFSVNDSNAKYLSFYDYKTYELFLSAFYQLSENLILSPELGYRKKIYDSRTVTNGNYKQKDALYSAGIGLIYKLNDKDRFSLDYIYRNNSSNDSFSRYLESVMSCSWKRSF